VARKRLSFKNYLLKILADKKPKRVKGVIGILVEPEDFMTVLTVLGGQDKNIPETIQFYEAFFRRFRLNSHLVDRYLTREDWHNWTEILIEMSNVLWKLRDKFEPDMWLETNAKIYEVTFINLYSDSKYSESGLCFVCLRLFTKVLFNFANHAREGDKSSDFHITNEKFKEISQMIGTRPDHITHANFIEEKISKHNS